MIKETEVKIELTEEDVENLGTIFRTCPKIFQRTYGYFTPNGQSIKDGIFPRIRETSKEGLTDKKTIELTIKIRKPDKDYFKRDEYNFMLDSFTDGDAMLKIFGFTKVIIFEKIRQTNTHKKLILCLDKLPFGWFLEVEGKESGIKEYLDSCWLNKNPRINRAYLGLWEDYRKKQNIKEEDCLLKNKW